MEDTTLYLDHAATTPVRPEALAAVSAAMEAGHGNASSGHGPGRAARAALEEARARVAAAIGATPREIVFTSGGTEADNLAVLGRWRAGAGGVAISAVEHSAVRAPAAAAAREGAALTTLAVDGEGRLDPGGLEEALEQDLAVVSVMWGNNETGTLQPVRQVAELCAARGVPFHTDAVQAVGHVPVRVDEVGCSLLSMSAHKFGGPPGVGALFVRAGTSLTPLVSGGGQERGVRAGTSNVPGALGLAVALERAVRDLGREAGRLAGLRDRLRTRIEAASPELHVNGGGADRLPHILSVGLDGVPADVLMASLDTAGLAVSAGSACHSGASEPSHVLVAMGRVSDAIVRFSFGWSSTAADVDRAAATFLEILERARAAIA
ncbi:MAG TPA: cysteine desulfurase family protein [Longimicrobiales bacterium]|nr:cysteine desulfurase family protein [Longimicrobiales bacterium]